MKVDGANADGAAARQRDSRLSEARHQRSQHQHRRPHLLDEFIRRHGIEQLAGFNLDAIAVRFVRDGGIDAQIFQQAAQRADVAHARNIVENHALVRQQRRRQCRQRRILGPADHHPAFQRPPAGYEKFVHGQPHKLSH